MLVALTRSVSPAIGQCELTHIGREPIDVERADRQHRQYEMALVNAGCDVDRLPAEPLLADAVFVEDTAVVLDELAIITRPGAESRRAEIASMAVALAAYRPLQHIEAPGTLDGGDVMLVGRTLYVGEGFRSNQAGIGQLRNIVQPFNYKVMAVPFRDCLHLKTAVTRVANETLLLNPKWVDRAIFEDCECIEVDPSEPDAANALDIDGQVIYPTNFPKTASRLELRNINLHKVDVSEFAKAEGGVTCCSLIFKRMD